MSYKVERDLISSSMDLKNFPKVFYAQRHLRSQPKIKCNLRVSLKIVDISWRILYREGTPRGFIDRCF